MRLGIFANTQKSLVGDVIPGVVDWLQANGAEVVVEKEAAEALHLDVPTAERRQVGRLADLVLAFGGDGTFLAAARDVGPSEVPILGVNLGGLGFLAGVTVGELYPSLEDVLKGNYEILERMVIRAEVEDEDGLVFNCLNDVVID
ncbi:MAG TPA: NAD(+)/NADH kinase, partial [Bacteroidetes bacterium]|nr:NAD(+)/NADH kinase [Bacteroidota bacterium]